jgi:hypothetical protein
VGEGGVLGLVGGDEGEDAHGAPAIRAGEGEYLVDSGEEASPAGACGGALRGVRQVDGLRRRGSIPPCGRSTEPCGQLFPGEDRIVPDRLT